MCVNNDIYMQSSYFSLSKNWLKFQEKLFLRGLVSHGKIDSAQVHLRSVFTYSAEEKMLSERNIW